MSARRRLFLFAAPAALAILLAGAAALCLRRVPAEHLGVLPDGSVVTPGLHLSFPGARMLLLPLAPQELSGDVEALTREGAAARYTYTLIARVDPERGGILGAALRHAGSGEDLRGKLAALLTLRVSEEPATDPERMAGDLRARLEKDGLQVERLDLARVAPAGAASGSRAQGPRLSHPIALIGLDGADWQLVDPLIQAGRLPHLARLKERAAWGHLRSFEPILSPLLWTTAATGRPPDEHGIVDFLMPDPATGQRLPITSRARKVRALWNIFDEHGLSSDVVAWWASFPAESIGGRIVTDRVAYSLFDLEGLRAAGAGLTTPGALWEELRPLAVPDDAITWEEISRFLDISKDDLSVALRRAREDREAAFSDPVHHLARILASTRTYHQMALRLLRERQPDLFMMYYQGIDEVCHRFMHFAPPRRDGVSPQLYARFNRAVEAFYVYQDALLGELMKSLAADTTVIVMSDHGFLSGAGRPADGTADIEGKPGKWHRLYGIVMLAGAGIQPSRLDQATLYDITPTILRLAGLPQSAEMPGRSLLDPAEGPVSIASYETTPLASGVEGASGAFSQGDDDLMRSLAALGYIAAGPARTQAAPVAPASLDATGISGTITGHTNLASLLLQKGDLQGAERELRLALARKAHYFPALMTLAQVLVRQGRTGEALDATRKAVASAPDAEQGSYVMLALLAARAGQASQAANFLETLARDRPRAPGIQTALGALAQQAGSRDAAEARYRAALQMDAASPDAMARLFQLYRQDGRETELEDEITRALKDNDQSVLHYNWQGLIQARRGASAAAERSYQRALDLAPDFAGTMANLGALYGRAGKLEEAAQVLARAVRIDPANLEARVNLGAALAKQGRPQEAIPHLEEALRRGPRSPDLLNALGLACAEAGDTQRAISLLRESLSAAPDQPQVKALVQRLAQPT